jgi:hypothetical protein
MAAIKYTLKKVGEISGKKKKTQVFNRREEFKCLAKTMATDAYAYDEFMTYVASKAPKMKKKKAE